MLLPPNFKIENLKRVVFGSEKSDDKLYKQVGEIFPEDRMSNIYPYTESGYLLKAFGDVFKISSELSTFIKIKDDELLIHTSLLGETTQSPYDND